MVNNVFHERGSLFTGIYKNFLILSRNSGEENLICTPTVRLERRFKLWFGW
jgi:hypothetical protein